jgi:hypothetical protein
MLTACFDSTEKTMTGSYNDDDKDGVKEVIDLCVSSNGARRRFDFQTTQSE